MMVLGQYGAIIVGTGWYLVVLGQWEAVLGQHNAVRADSIWVSG